MTTPQKHKRNIVQDIQRVAKQISEVLLDLAIEIDETGNRDYLTDRKCRETIRNITDQEFREEWAQFYSTYINGVK